MNMEELLICYQQELFALTPNLESQRWNSGTLTTETLSHSGIWWQIDAVDSVGNEYILCWFDDNAEEDDDGIVAFDLYKPDLIQCISYIED